MLLISNPLAGSRVALLGASASNVQLAPQVAQTGASAVSVITHPRETDSGPVVQVVRNLPPQYENRWAPQESLLTTATNDLPNSGSSGDSSTPSSSGTLSARDEKRQLARVLNNQDDTAGPNV